MQSFRGTADSLEWSQQGFPSAMLDMAQRPWDTETVGAPRGFLEETRPGTSEERRVEERRKSRQKAQHKQAVRRGERIRDGGHR